MNRKGYKKSGGVQDVAALFLFILAGASSACSRPDDWKGFDPLSDVAFVPPDAISSRDDSAARGFFLGITEVTNLEYSQFLRTDNYQSTTPGFLSHWKRGTDGALEPPPGLEAHPVVNLSMEDALAFCRSRGMRLPTKTEWEAAASFGVTGGYPFGVWQTLRANTLELGLGHTTPVGLFETGKSFLHLYDLAGNVGEMTLWPGDGVIIKGGSYLQNSTRILPPDEEPPMGAGFAAQDVGFRCAADAVPFITQRVLRVDIPFDARVNALARFLKRSGGAARTLLDEIVANHPDLRTVVNAAVSAQYK